MKPQFTNAPDSNIFTQMWNSTWNEYWTQRFLYVFITSLSWNPLFKKGGTLKRILIFVESSWVSSPESSWVSSPNCVPYYKLTPSLPSFLILSWYRRDFRNSFNLLENLNITLVKKIQYICKIISFAFSILCTFVGFFSFYFILE